MSSTHTKISTEIAENILSEHFDINGSATSLPGEIDFNFKIKVQGESLYILKISRPNNSDNRINFQQKLL